MLGSAIFTATDYARRREHLSRMELIAGPEVDGYWGCSVVGSHWDFSCSTSAGRIWEYQGISPHSSSSLMRLMPLEVEVLMATGSMCNGNTTIAHWTARPKGREERNAECQVSSSLCSIMLTWRLRMSDSQHIECDSQPLSPNVNENHRAGLHWMCHFNRIHPRIFRACLTTQILQILWRIHCKNYTNNLILLYISFWDSIAGRNQQST